MFAEDHKLEVNMFGSLQLSRKAFNGTMMLFTIYYRCPGKRKGAGLAVIVKRQYPRNVFVMNTCTLLSKYVCFFFLAEMWGGGGGEMKQMFLC